MLGGGEGGVRKEEEKQERRPCAERQGGRGGKGDRRVQAGNGKNEEG